MTIGRLAIELSRCHMYFPIPTVVVHPIFSGTIMIALHWWNWRIRIYRVPSLKDFEVWFQDFKEEKDG